MNVRFQLIHFLSIYFKPADFYVYFIQKYLILVFYNLTPKHSCQIGLSNKMLYISQNHLTMLSFAHVQQLTVNDPNYDLLGIFELYREFVYFWTLQV